MAAFEAAAAADPNNRSIQVELVRSLRCLDRLDEAELVVNSILDAEPHQVGAMIERGHLLRRRGDRVGAAKAFKAAATTDPSNRNIQVELARDLRALERLDEADFVLGRVLEAEARHVGALIECGHLRRRRGDHEGAAAAFKAAATIDPTNRNIQVELARDLRALNRLDEAEDILRVVSQDGSVHAGALVELAHVCRLRGNSAGTLATLEAAAKVAPENLDVRIALAGEYGEQNRFDAALRVLEEILATNPNHLAASLRLGQLHRQRGDLQKSIEALQTVLKIHPKHTQALVELARTTWAAGEPVSAQQILAQVRSQEPTHLGAIVASAEQALLANDTQSALQLACRAIEFHPGQLGPYLLGVRAAAELLDRDEAERLLNQARVAFGLRPEIAAVHIHILRLYRDYDSARAIIEASAEGVAKNFGLWMQATSFAIVQGEFEIAERALSSAPAASTKEMARVHFLRSSVAEARRQYPEAIAGYKAAIALDESEAGIP